jgi:hypothetical protein
MIMTNCEIAGRMAGALPQEQIRQIVALVQGFEKREAQPLDDLGAEVRAHIAKSFSNRRPFEQGEAAANFVRARLNLRNEEEVDVFGAVEGLGVSVHPESVEPSTLLGTPSWSRGALKRDLAAVSACG